MSNIVISVENLSKSYRLGQIGTGTLSRDLEVWWAKVRGKPNPLLKIGQTDHGNQDGQTLWALQDVSFQVQQGEVLGIIGRNGAGKSTLLKILSRVTAPTSGLVKVKGRIASLLEVGTGFHPELTGRENIFLNGAILGMSKEEVQRKFDEIVSFAEVDKFVDTPVKRYSSGMYVRLAFAVAAHLESEILLVDEVLAVGDAEFQKKCLGKMGDVATNEGRTVFFVSHNMGSVRTLCETGILLEKGKIKKNESISEVIDHYIGNNKSVDLNNNFELDNETENIPKYKFIRKISLFNSNSKITNSLFMDEDISINIYLSDLIKIKGLRIGVSFNTIDGQRIFIIDTDMSADLSKFTFSENDLLTLELRNLPLNPGKYSLDVIVASHFDGRIEFAQDCIRFSVLAKNIFNNNYLLTNKYGMIFHKYSNWSFKNLDQ